MRLRGVPIVILAILGCESLRDSNPVSPRGVAVAGNASPVSGITLVEARAIDPPTVAPSAPEESDDPLTLAAECLQRGDQASAAGHLGAYVRLHPDQIMFRAHLAELLLKLERVDESRDHFDRFIAAAQETSGPPRDHLVHCHTRLMEIAHRRKDAFAESFHRGVGLWLLFRQTPSDSRDEGFGEEVLCKALAALNEAKEYQPTDPRVHVYLAEVHEAMGNRRAAATARASARNLLIPHALTESEQFRLSMGLDR
jgi:hypothetical protein